MISLTLSDREARMGARAVLSWPSLGAEHLTDYLEVEVHQNHRGVWWVQGWLDFRFSPDLSWGITRVIDGREEAAREAADIWAEGVRLALAYHRGEPLEPPGVRMRRAWQEGDGRGLTAALDRLRERRGDLTGDRERFALSWSGHEAVAREYDLALSAWMRSADWRAYRDLGHREVKPENSHRLATAADVGEWGQLDLWREAG